MKYSAVLATLVAVASAQQACDPSVIPSCARNLIDSNVQAVTGCNANDYKCICSPAAQTKLAGAVTTQILAACGADKVADVLSATEKFCTAVLSGSCGSGSSSSAAGSSSTSSARPPVFSTTGPMSSSSSARPTTSGSATTTSRPSATLPTPSGNGTTPRPTGPVQAGASMLTVAGSGLAVAVAFALL